MQTHAITPTQRTVLVTGGNGFLGGYIVAELRRRGWQAVLAVRPHGRALRVDERACDLARMRAAADWLPVLRGIDAVVNVAGILRESGRQSFAAIHVDAPLALAHACVQVGIKRFVQISALGMPEDGEFVASKHRFDEALLALPMQAVVLRPSVVYATTGSYGGTTLLRALAGFPGVQLLPGDGRWPIQPVAAEDLAALVADALDGDQSGVYDVGGPQAMPLREYQQAWRHWLRIPGRHTWRVPSLLAALTATACDWLGNGPVGRTMWRMLQRGNVTTTDAHTRLQADFHHAPRPLAEVLALRPSQVQDRWHAQLYFLAPALRIAVALLWVLSALSGWLTPTATIEHMVDMSVLQQLSPIMSARATATLDGLLGLWLLSSWRPRLAVGLMMISVLAYTLVFGLTLPHVWLAPLGGLAKNLALLPALGVLWVLLDRR